MSGIFFSIYRDFFPRIFSQSVEQFPEQMFFATRCFLHAVKNQPLAT